MSVELISVLIAVVAVGGSLAGLMLSGQRAIRTELIELRQELTAQRRDFSAEFVTQRRDFSAELATHRQEINAELAELHQELAAQRRDFSTELAAQRKEFGKRFTALEQQIAELRERMAHLAGLLDGLREAIAIQRGAA